MKLYQRSIIKAIIATILFILVIELIGVWSILAETLGFTNYFEYYRFIQGALQFIVILTFIFFVKKQNFKNFIQKTSFKWYLFAVLLGISFVFIQVPLKWFYNFLFETNYNIAFRFDGLPKFTNINILTSVLFAPISEEFFFRDYIQNGLQRSINRIFAILLASILFASIHSPYLNLILEFTKQDWHLFYLTFFGGVISGIFYLVSKSVGPSILFHIFWNVMVTIV